VAGSAFESAALLDRLDQAILAKAFRGELVLQDPNDEPASVLLERIRASRAAQAAPIVRRCRVARSSANGP
jgi:type I restriction enzyme S subunit